MRQYNVSPKIIGQTPLDGLAMFRKQIAPRTCAMHSWTYVHVCDTWTKIRIVGKNHLQNLLDENNHSNVQIPYHENHQVKGWYVNQKPIWTSWKKVWGFGLVHNLPQKEEECHFILGKRLLRAKNWELKWFYDERGWRNKGKGLCWVWIFVDMNQCEP